MITVFNVGNGDSFLIEDDELSYPLLIDTGPRGANVVSKLNPNHLSVLITHSHRDHIGGLPQILRQKTINTLYIPYYLPEINKIASYLSKYLKGFANKINWNIICKYKLVLVYDTCTIDRKIPVFNPQQTLFSTSTISSSSIDIQNALEQLHNIGIELPADEIINYKSPIINHIDGDDNLQYNDYARNFVHDYFIQLYEILSKPNKTTQNRKIMLEYHIFKSHDVSVICKYTDNENSVLFTGDASSAAFDRLIDSNRPIQSTILKIAHHGSKHNTSSKTLNYIHPGYSIISHNNSKFGKCKDTHPHWEVLYLLATSNITQYFTNDVIKQGQKVASATSGSVLGNFIVFK